MNHSHHRWLHAQLPQWERDGLITPDAARTLREKHAVDDSQPSVGQIVMGSLGALLIGAGLIAVIGYNWDDYSRPVRLLFAFLPLLAAQVLSFRVLQRGAAALDWVRESSALFQALATGACIAIISQIYNLGGEWPDFLFWWMLLSLPLAWVMRSKSVVIFYLIGITVWSIDRTDLNAQWHNSALLYPILFLGIAPFWPGWPPRWQLSPSLRYIITLSVGLGLAAAASSSMALYNHAGSGRDYDVVFWLWIFTTTAIFLLPSSPPGPDDKRDHHPHVTLDGLFLLPLAFVGTFSDWHSNALQELKNALAQPWAWLSLTCVVVFLVSAIRQQRWGLVGFSSLLLTPMLALAAGPSGEGLLPWLMTFHLLLLGVLLIVLDLIGKRGAPRLGAAIICALIMTRMFQSDLSMLLKGLVFIIVGVAFLAFNILMSRAHKRKQNAVLP